MRALFQILIGVATDEHRREQHHDQHAQRADRATGRTGGDARSSGRRAPGGAARARSARAAARPASRPGASRSICQTRRGRLVKTNGEKCQMASFGQSSRRPPPAKPQPTAKGSAMISPVASGGRPTSAPTIAPAYGPAIEPGEERAFERQVGGVVVEQQPRGDAGGERDAEAEGEDQAIGPVAALEDQDVAEPAVPHQHRRQRGHRRRA